MKFLLSHPGFRRFLITLLYKYEDKTSSQIANFNKDYISREIQAYGWYEKPFLIFLERIIKKKIGKNSYNSYAIDVGANIGNHSLYFSSFMNTISIEPNPVCIHLLKSSIIANNLKNITLIEKGAGDTKMKKELTFDLSHTGGGSFKNTNNHSQPITKTVQIDTLDSIINELNIGKYSIDFIKIDTEDFEYEVLKGAKNILNDFSPLIAFEASSRESLIKIKDLLTKKGYLHFYNLIQSRRKFKNRFLNILYMMINPLRIDVTSLEDTSFEHFQMILASKDKLDI